MASYHFVPIKMIVIICVFSAVINLASSLAIEKNSDVSEGRTFGHHFLKRLSFAIIPMAFIFGVIKTLLAALTVMSMKGLGIGVLLLILGLSQVLAKALPVSHPAPLPVVYSHHIRDVAPAPQIWAKEEWNGAPYTSHYGHA